MLYMCLFCLYVCLYTMYIEPEEAIRALGTGVEDGFELPFGCWELTTGPMQEQTVLLTIEPPPSPDRREL